MSFEWDSTMAKKNERGHGERCVFDRYEREILDDWSQSNSSRPKSRGGSLQRSPPVISLREIENNGRDRRAPPQRASSNSFCIDKDEWNQPRSPRAKSWGRVLPESIPPFEDDAGLSPRTREAEECTLRKSFPSPQSAAAALCERTQVNFSDDKSVRLAPSPTPASRLSEFTPTPSSTVARSSTFSTASLNYFRRMERNNPVVPRRPYDLFDSSPPRTPRKRRYETEWEHGENEFLAASRRLAGVAPHRRHSNVESSSSAVARRSESVNVSSDSESQEEVDKRQSRRRQTDQTRNDVATLEAATKYYKATERSVDAAQKALERAQEDLDRACREKEDARRYLEKVEKSAEVIQIDDSEDED